MKRKNPRRHPVKPVKPVQPAQLREIHGGIGSWPTPEATIYPFLQ